MFQTTLWLTLGVVVPLTLGVGILASFRIAGPLYRFEVHMKQVSHGEDPGPCRIRRGDMLQGFCDQLNALTEPMRVYNRAKRKQLLNTSVDELESLVGSKSSEQEPTPA